MSEKISHHAGEIGARLKRTREALGMTQVELCASSGLSPSRYNLYERGKRRITADAANAISTATGVSLDWIFRGDAGALDRSLLEVMARRDN